MRKIKQAQNEGDSSINLQAGKIVINQGPTPAEIKAIALGVFNENILKFSAEGSKIASRRAEEITDAFVEKLRIAPAVSLEGIKDPGFQYALFEAQKTYARFGEKDMSDVLVDLLIDRVAQNQRGLCKSFSTNA